MTGNPFMLLKDRAKNEILNDVPSDFELFVITFNISLRI